MTAVNLLDLVPERRADESGRIEGKVQFEFPRFTSTPGRWLARLLGASPTIKLTSDEIATAVWDLIDGDRDVAAIGEALDARFGEQVQPLHPRLAAMLTLFERNRLIRYRQPEGV